MADVLLPRYFDYDGALLMLSRCPHERIIASLEKLVTKYSPYVGAFPSNELKGLFRGPASMAYLLFKLSEPGTGYETLKVRECSLRQRADACLVCATKSVGEDHQSDEETECSRYGTLFEIPARLAVRAAFSNDEAAVRELLVSLPRVLERGREKVWNACLYGHAGYLYLLRLVRTHWPSAPIPPATFTKITECILF